MKTRRGDLAGEVTGLGDLSREELLARWEKAYGAPAPKSIRHDLLVRSAAWHLQAARLGGFSPATRRALKAAVADVERKFAAKRSTLRGLAGSAPPRQAASPGQTAASSSARAIVSAASSRPCLADSRPKAPARLAPGARLIRDWNGRSHVVDVIEEGFVFQARTYSSLTAIARQITGAHWSGPRFFGL